MTEGLLPCPCCGAKAKIGLVRRDDKPHRSLADCFSWYVYCVDDESCGMRIGRYNTLREAIDTWNGQEVRMDSHDCDTCKYRDNTMEMEPCKSCASVSGTCKGWEPESEDD